MGRGNSWERGKQKADFRNDFYEELTLLMAAVQVGSPRARLAAWAYRLLTWQYQPGKMLY